MKRKRLKKKKKTKIEDSSSSDDITDIEPLVKYLFRFPFSSEARKAILITEDDLVRLEEGQYLNDNLIDLSLRITAMQFPKDSLKIHVFTSQFYAKLSEPGNEQEDIAIYGKVAPLDQRLTVTHCKNIPFPH